MIRTSVPAATLRAAVTAAVRDVHPQIALSFDTMQLAGVAARCRPRPSWPPSPAPSASWPGPSPRIGLYGVMSYLVTRRRNEIGIRMALGADRAAVVKMVLRESAFLLALGVGRRRRAGGGGGAGGGRFALRADRGRPVTLAQAVAVLVMVSALATYVPAERAARIDPMRALREE